ncbi:TraC family protein [Rhizobium sp. AB2/73]|uniref:TraC family protein n=1 Tax=Rhizobium sp. AB2/73 TaxID=2795216 RepID=UPI000DDD49DC|nr:TraC family protein [Rhizobium sp. AB2/73]QYA13724.1 pilus assembly protein [Rhizobium sp. AB2/73]UEQ80346.1 pilus assembly protein [Rhizobium sp. AB2/73]
MRARSTASEMDTQIELLREKRKRMVAKDNERFASAARRAGLAELDISDAELNEVLAEITARFRDGEKRKTGAST